MGVKMLRFISVLFFFSGSPLWAQSSSGGSLIFTLAPNPHLGNYQIGFFVDPVIDCGPNCINVGASGPSLWAVNDATSWEDVAFQLQAAVRAWAVNVSPTIGGAYQKFTATYSGNQLTLTSGSVGSESRVFYTTTEIPNYFDLDQVNYTNTSGVGPYNAAYTPGWTDPVPLVGFSGAFSDSGASLPAEIIYAGAAVVALLTLLILYRRTKQVVQGA